MYVRLAGSVCNLFIVIPYIPHRGRKQAPYTQDTIRQVSELLKTVVRKTDCIIMMGDLNCELQRNVSGYTGKWCMTRSKDSGHGEEILSLIREFDLSAVDTLFKPARKAWGKDKKMRYCNATYMAKKRRQETKEIGLHLCVQ